MCRLFPFDGFILIPGKSLHKVLARAGKAKCVSGRSRSVWIRDCDRDLYRCSDAAGRGLKNPCRCEKIATSGTAFAAVPPGFHAKSVTLVPIGRDVTDPTRPGLLIFPPAACSPMKGERRKRTAGQRHRAGLQPVTDTLLGHPDLSALFLVTFRDGSARKHARNRLFDPVHYSTNCPAMQEENGKNCCNFSAGVL